MTKILFVQKVLFDHHSIECLSAALKQAKHEVDLYVIDSEKQGLEAYIKKTNPDIVSFSPTSTDYKWAVDSARIAKRLNKTSLFGGPHPTYFPEFITEPCVDVICIGEGEQAIVEFADAVQNKKDYTKIRNLYVKKDGKVFKNPLRPLVEDLDELPDPDKLIYYKYKFLRETPVKRIMTSRGCPYNCTYCYNQRYKALYKGKGRYVRYRSKERIINELMEIRKHAVLKAITFTSDTFASDKRWLLNFLKCYKERIGIPFHCQLRFNEVSEEVIKALKEANCRYIYFGLEAGNDYIRNKVYKKGVTNKQIINAARLLHKYNIKFLTYNIFGAPHETMEQAWETIRLNQKIKPDSTSANILQPMVGTELHQMILDEGLFIPGNENIMFSHFVASPIRLKHKTTMENLQKMTYFPIIYPITTPLIKLLINLPPNPFFELLFRFSLLLKYKRSRGYSFIDLVKVGWNFRKFS